MAARFAEIFEGYVIDNFMFIVNRDMKTRLDEFYMPGENLPDFVEKTLGKFTGLSNPAFVLDPFKGAAPEGEEYVENEITLEALIRVVDPDPAVVTRKVVKYKRAFQSVVRSATRSDWFRNITSPQIMPYTISISWEYGTIGKNPNLANVWVRDVKFEITFRFNER